MVGLAIEALRAHPTPLQHSHILVDEAQDTSEKQLQVLPLSLRHTYVQLHTYVHLHTPAHVHLHTPAQLLQLLAPRGVVALTAVGDDDQTIYGFRGSRPDVPSPLHTLCALCIHAPTQHRFSSGLASSGVATRTCCQQTTAARPVCSTRRAP